jgi:hypothetical protein
MNAIYALIKLAYKSILRDLVKKAIDNPESEVDEFVLSLLDKLFDYSS